MTLQEYIQEFGDNIDAFVLEHYNVRIDDDDEREEWIMNEEWLYQAAQMSGVENL